LPDPEKAGAALAFLRTWLSTANGLEAHAALRSDKTFVLDEINQIDPKELDRAIYLLSEGIGKGRANKSGGAASEAQFRVFVLSSGEHSIESHLAKGNIQAKAGQSVRLLDIMLGRELNRPERHFLKIFIISPIRMNSAVQSGLQPVVTMVMQARCS